MSVRQDNTSQSARIETSSGWMLTFADLLSLLLTFFVLLYSMSSVQVETWKAVVTTMTQQFNPNRPKIAIDPTQPPEKLTESRRPGLNLTYLQARFEGIIANEAALAGTQVTLAGDSVVVSIPAKLLFGRKDALLNTTAAKALSDLAGTLMQIENRIRVAGHTDSVPISNGKFRSNWELSMTRARIVAGVLTDTGYNQSITVLGYADTVGEGPEAASRLIDERLLERIDIIIIADRKDMGPHALF